jgi:AraC-like DNA-binding protein
VPSLDWLAAARSALAADISPGVGVDWRHLGDAVALTRWRCRERDPRPRGDKQQLWHVIGFVRGGAFRLRDASTDGVADATRLLFYNPGSSYETSHPCGCGDHGGALVLREDLARELVGRWDAGAAGAARAVFPRALGAGEPRLQAEFWSLLRSLADPGGGRPAIESLSVEERAIGIAARAVARLFAGRPPEAVVDRPTTARAARRRRERAIRVQELLWRRMAEGVRLADLAAEVGISACRLCHEFRATTGCTVHGYLIRLRLARAAELLESGGGRDLSALAHDLGFSSHSHFTSAFRAAFGATPSRVRALDQGHAGALHRHVGAGAHRDPHLGLGEGGSGCRPGAGLRSLRRS